MNSVVEHGAYNILIFENAEPLAKTFILVGIRILLHYKKFSDF